MVHTSVRAVQPWKFRFTLRGLARTAVVLGACVPMSGCQTLREITALQNVEFAFDQVTDVRLADVSLDGVRSYQDLGVGGTATILSAWASGRLPLSLQVDVRAENPEENAVTARLAQLDWALLLEDRETVSGTVGEEFVLPPGQPTTIPVRAELDLLEFFEGSGPDLVELVLALSGNGGAPKQVAVRIQPTIQTALGPMRYPRPITVVNQRVGGS